MNLRSLIQPSETLSVELNRTHRSKGILILLYIDEVWGYLQFVLLIYHRVKMK